MSNLQLLFEAPIFSVQLLLDGILIGGVFALAAFGMALVWGVMNIINIAQGELVILGGFVTYFVYEAGFSPFLGIPVSAIVVFCVAWLLYRAVIFRVVDKDLFISLLATFGISILLQQLMNEVFGADIVSADSGLENYQLFDNRVSVTQIKVVSFFISLAFALGLVLFLKKSRLGQAIRATAQNARAARILGIDTDKVYATTFALNGAICGVAGSLIVMTWIIHPYVGLVYTVRAFMIVVVAGLGNLAMVVLSGFGLGVAENVAGFLLGAEFQIAFVFSLLVVILAWRNYRLGRQRKYLK